MSQLVEILEIFESKELSKYTDNTIKFAVLEESVSCQLCHKSTNLVEYYSMTEVGIAECYNCMSLDVKNNR